MSRHLSLLLLASLIVLELDMITSIIPLSCLYGRCQIVQEGAGGEEGGASLDEVKTRT